MVASRIEKVTSKINEVSSFNSCSLSLTAQGGESSFVTQNLFIVSPAEKGGKYGYFMNLYESKNLHPRQQQNFNIHLI